MKKGIGAAWDISKFKWVYWIAIIGFIVSLNLVLWGITLILYLVFDRNKPKTKDYRIKKIYEKYILIVGLLNFVWFILMLFGL